MLKKTTLMLLMVSSMIFIYGCGDDPSIAAKKVDIPVPDIQVAQKSKSININVYIDGTYSMSGYVKSVKGTTNFIDALKGIEKTANSNWDKDTVQYIKFGDTYQNLNRDDFFNSIKKENFYNQVNTKLEDVISKIDTKKLNIIVTDLFQTDQNLESLKIALKNKRIIGPDSALAIIGLKSQFNGKIYDVTQDGKPFEYNSAEDEKAFRPFYLLIAGDEANVRDYVMHYKKDMLGKTSYLKSVMFSKNIGSKNSLKPGEASNKGVKAKNMQPNSINQNLSNAGYLQYRWLLEEPKSKAAVVLNSWGVINAPKLGYNLVADKIEKLNITKDSTGKGTGRFESTDSRNDFLVASFDDTKNLEIKDHKVSYAFNAVFTPAAIKDTKENPRAGIYRVGMALVSDKDEYMKSCVNEFNDWNFTLRELDLKNPKLVGSRTLNISEFVESISNLNYTINKPGFYDLYMYLDAKQ